MSVVVMWSCVFWVCTEDGLWVCIEDRVDRLVG